MSRTLAWERVRLSYPNKPKRWIIAQYFGMFNPARQDKWVFGSPETGFYLRKFAWTKIVRHRIVAARAFPDDPALAGYWDQRRRRARRLPGMGVIDCGSCYHPCAQSEVTWTWARAG